MFNRTEILRLEKFQDLTDRHLPGIKSPIARYTVSDQLAYGIMGGSALELMIPTREVHALTNDATTSEEVTLSVRTAAGQNPLGLERSIRWEVWAPDVATGTLSQVATLEELTIVGAKVTGPKPASTACEVLIYHIPLTGLVFVDKTDSQGAVRQVSTMYTEDLTILHTINQYRKGAVPKFDSTHLLLEEMAIEISLVADWKPHLSNPLAVASLSINPVTMDEVLTSARSDIGRPDLSPAELRRSLVATWG